MRETITDFKQRSDFAAIAYVLELTGIDARQPRFEKLITRFKNVAEICIIYNYKLSAADVAAFHKKKKAG